MVFDNSLNELATASVNKQGSNGCVLIAEDTTNWLDLYKTAFRDMGFTVWTARSYAEAIGLLRRESFSLAIVDLQLGGRPNNLDGIFLLEELMIKKVPGIIVTAWAIPRLADAIFQDYSSVFQILDKGSFDWDTFREYVKQATSSWLPEHEGDSTSSEAKQRKFNQLIQEVLASLGAPDRAYYQELASQAHTDLPTIGWNSDSPVDFAIITALEVEAKAMIGQIGDCQIERAEEHDIHTYHCGTVPISGTDKVYHVVLVRLISMGTLPAALVTLHVMARWKPRFILMVGIAGGMPQDDLDLGDVVVADQVIGYDYGKIDKQGLQPRDQVYPVGRLLLERVRSFDDEKWNGHLGVSRPTNAKRLYSKRFIGPIASGNKVIASQSSRQQLLKRWPKLIAVEMEAEGVMAAAFEHSPPIPIMVIRGISDMADERKSDEWHEYAAQAAAVFTGQFLKSGPVDTGAKEFQIK